MPDGEVIDLSTPRHGTSFEGKLRTDSPAPSNSSIIKMNMDSSDEDESKSIDPMEII